METRLADVCSRTAVRSRLNRYLCKWLSIILSGQSGEQLQRNCMSREIICISLRANYWLSCLRGFNRRPAVGYSYVFLFFLKTCVWSIFLHIGSNTPQVQRVMFSSGREAVQQSCDLSHQSSISGIANKRQSPLWCIPKISLFST